jgi:hypothetical protein
MRNGLLLVVAALLALFAFAAPAAEAQKKPRVVVGMGDQKPSMFSDPRLPWLGIRKARIIVPWYVGEKWASAEEREYVDRWLQAARRNGFQPLVGFSRGSNGASRIYLPKPREYSSAMAAFRKRWPFVKNFIAWNEANHCSALTCRAPKRAAAFYDALVKRCRTCTIVATAVLDSANMVTWLKRFQKAAKNRVKILGLHNYLDVNRLRMTGTKRLLRAFKGRIWVTETGGLVFRRHYKGQASFPESEPHAAKATHWALTKTSRLSRRIERIYLYQWNQDRPDPIWDSGLVDWQGNARQGFRVLAKFMGRDWRKAPRPPEITQPPPPPPIQEEPTGEAGPPPQQGSGGGEQPPPDDGSGGGTPTPALPGCPIPALCPAVGSTGLLALLG